MKLISLNTWGGKVAEPLLSFIKRESKDTDIFCFQEVLKGGTGVTSRGEMKGWYEMVSSLLPTHTGYFAPYGEDGYYGESLQGADFEYGIATFVRANLPQSYIGDMALYDYGRTWDDYTDRFAAGESCALIVGDIGVVNVHGMWQSNQKCDSEARFEQSRRIVALAKQTGSNCIMCGDFNLRPDIESVRMIEQMPTRNLIKEYNITSTRSIHYDKDMPFADYVFVSPEIQVTSFEVLPDEVSDHLAMSLVFNL